MAKFHLKRGSGELRHVAVPNFVKFGSWIVEILRFFHFSKRSSSPSWIFQFAKFYWLSGSRGLRRITMPNLVKIGKAIAEILQFFEFLRWPLLPPRIFELVKFYYLTWSVYPRHIIVQIFCQNRSISCRDIAIFRFLKMVAVRHLTDLFRAYLDHLQRVLGIFNTL